MLILSRNPGQRIFIMGPDMKKVEVCITLLKTKGCQSSIGIDCDESYTILREEVFLRNAQESADEDYPDL